MSESNPRQTATSWQKLVDRATSKWVLRIFFIAIICLLVYQVSRIGVVEVLSSLPTNPFFYLISILLVFSLPVAEIFVYRKSWHFKGLSIFGMLVKKGVLNKEVLGYSGELLVYAWGRRNVDLSDPEILRTIRDNNILSSFSSTLVAITLIVVFAATGEISLSDLSGNADSVMIVAVAAALVVIAGIAYRFRRFWFSMDPRTAVAIGGIYVTRQLVGMTLQIAQWSLALPAIGVKLWFTFAAASLILSRVPVVPNKDLLFVSAGIGLAGIMDMSSASVAGMLLAISGLRRLINLLLFSGVTLLERRNESVDGELADRSDTPSASVDDSTEPEAAGNFDPPAVPEGTSRHITS